MWAKRLRCVGLKGLLCLGMLVSGCGTETAPDTAKKVVQQGSTTVSSSSADSSTGQGGDDPTSSVSSSAVTSGEGGASASTSAASGGAGGEGGSDMGGGGSGSGGEDVPVVGAPTWPANATLSALDVGCVSALLTWPNAIDDVAVTTYRVLQDGVKVADLTPAQNSLYRLSGLKCDSTYTIEVRAGDVDDHWSNPLSLSITTPTLPVFVPPSKIPTRDFCGQVSWLWQGVNAPQQEVKPLALHCRETAVIRGTVTACDGTPIPGVKVSASDDPNVGWTLTRADGMFDLAVNAGGEVRIRLESAGFLPVERQVPARWNEFSFAAPMVMTPMDPQTMLVNLDDQVHAITGPEVQDADGVRHERLLFRAGTKAALVLGDQETPIDQLHVHSTEYTVGECGERAMPASLPASSAYTYALEFSVDEAIKAGAERVTFDPPLVGYTDNFLKFPVGLPIPIGSYDRECGCWIPSKTGQVISILDALNDQPLIDLDGDTMPESEAALDAVGIDQEEREYLANLFAEYNPDPNQAEPVELWRTEIPHFSAWDKNKGWGPTDGAEAPPDDPIILLSEDDPLCFEGSVLDCSNGGVSEIIPIAGSNYKLVYSSGRTKDFKAASSMSIPITGKSVPPGLLRADLEIQIAGQLVKKSFQPLPNQNFSFTWDGKNGWGQSLDAKQPVKTRLDYVYKIQYGKVADFGMPANGVVSADEARGEFLIGRLWQGYLGPPRPSLSAFTSGWSLSIHNIYDPLSNTFFEGSGRTRVLGDGERQSVDHLQRSWLPTVRTVAGSIEEPKCQPNDPECYFKGDNGPAVEADLCQPNDVVVAPDGAIYFADGCNCRVRRIDPQTGIIATVAGTAQFKYDPTCLSPKDPTKSIEMPVRLALDRDGHLFILSFTFGNEALYRLNLEDETLEKWGTSGFPPSPDGSNVLEAPINMVGAGYGLATGPDCSVYYTENTFDDQSNLYSKVRRIGPDGVLRTIAGGPAGDAVDSVPALQAAFQHAMGLAYADGSLYIVDEQNYYIRRMDLRTGIVTKFAGNGFWGKAGKNGPALLANVTARYITTGPDGSVYFDRAQEDAIDRVSPVNGYLTHFAGGPPGWSADLSLAPEAYIGEVSGMAFGPDGRLLLASHSFSEFGDRLLAVAWPRPLQAPAKNLILKKGPGDPEDPVNNIWMPDEQGTFIDVYSGTGRHLEIRDARTLDLRREFVYDQNNALVGVKEQNGQMTTFERDPKTNQVVKVIGLNGESATLSYDNLDRVTQVTAPNGATQVFEYSGSSELMSTFTNPLGHKTTFTYDAIGRLLKESRADGSSMAMQRTESASQKVVTLTTAMGRSMKYTTTSLAGGAKEVVAEEAGYSLKTVTQSNGSWKTTTPFGSAETTMTPDPRWGMLAPYASKGVQTIGWRTLTSTLARTVVLKDNNPFLLETEHDALNVYGQKLDMTYTTSNRSLLIKDAAGRSTLMMFDAGGRLLQSEATGLPTMKASYDLLGRMTNVTYGDTTKQYTYVQASGLVGSLTLGGFSGSFAYDVMEQTVETKTGPSVVAYGYDKAGQLTGLTPAGKSVHGFNYTPTGQIAVYSSPAGQKISYDYDQDSDLQTVTRPDGSKITYVRDADGRLIKRSTSDGDVTLKYDASDNLLGLDGPQGQSISYLYDSILLSSITWDGLWKVSFTYDADAALVAELVGPWLVSRTHNASGALTQVGDMSLTVNPDTNLVTEAVMANVNQAFGHTADGKLTAHDVKVNGELLYQDSYQYDDRALVTDMVETVDGVAQTSVYTYTSTSRLDSVKLDGQSVAQAEYDPNGNRIKLTTPQGVMTANFDADDRITSRTTPSEDWSYGYDLNGQRLAATEKKSGTNIIYGYDAFGNLVSVKLPNAQTISYLIDAQGRRTGRLIDGQLDRRWVYYDELRPAGEIDAQGNWTTLFVYAVHTNVPDYMFKAGKTYQFIHDRRGSVRLVVDSITGEVVQRLSYDAWGTVVEDTNPGFQPFGFAGGLYDHATQLSHFGARDYDPPSAQWLTRDPMLFGGGDTSLYGYVGGNPVNFLDSDGQICIPCAMAAMVIVGGLTVSNHDSDWQNVALLPLNLPGGAPLVATGIGKAASRIWRGMQGMSPGYVRVNLLCPSWMRTAALRISSRNGRQFENAAMKMLGEAKNTKTFAMNVGGKVVNVIPEAVSAGNPIVLELKDKAIVWGTKQIMGEIELANQLGKTFILGVSPKTVYISKTLQQAVIAQGGETWVVDTTTKLVTNWPK